ncbi:MAG: type IVB secretion system protein IcmX [Legionellales bacterium]
MKLLSKFVLLNLFCFTTCYAAAGPNEPGAAVSGGSTEGPGQLNTSLTNLGSYLGFDITQAPTALTPPITVSSNLLSLSAIQGAQTYLYNTFLGAIPIQALASFVSTSANIPGAASINGFVDATFNSSTSPYSTPANNPSNTPAAGSASSQSGAVTVNALIDQQTYQNDPVSQALLNILGTPDISYCTNIQGTSWDPTCAAFSGWTKNGSSPSPMPMTNYQVVNNIIGPLPTGSELTNGPKSFWDASYNQTFIDQLNSNSLLSPLLYNNTSSNSNTSQSSGLTSQSQAQQAANFVRYVSGLVTPTSLPKAQDYNALFYVATQANPPSALLQVQAQNTIATYFTNLRVYAAQSSVGIGNLYYILSKRMPQGTGSNPTTSQAMSEFTMATWRLVNPNTSGGQTQWITQINSASPATVQKEIATLLAEINYQLYLNRQQEERMLLTNTIMLMQSTKTGQPTANFAATGGPAYQ